MLMTPIRL